MSNAELLNYMATGFVLLGFAVIGVGWYRAKNREATEDHLRAEGGDKDNTIVRLRGDLDDLRGDVRRAEGRATAQDLVIAGLRAEVEALQRSADGSAGPIKAMADLTRDLLREMMTAITEITAQLRTHRDVAETGIEHVEAQGEQILDEVRADDHG